MPPKSLKSVRSFGLASDFPLAAVRQDPAPSDSVAARASGRITSLEGCACTWPDQRLCRLSSRC